MPRFWRARPAQFDGTASGLGVNSLASTASAQLGRTLVPMMARSANQAGLVIRCGAGAGCLFELSAVWCGDARLALIGGAPATEEQPSSRLGLRQKKTPVETHQAARRDFSFPVRPRTVDFVNFQSFAEDESCGYKTRRSQPHRVLIMLKI